MLKSKPNLESKTTIANISTVTLGLETKIEACVPEIQQYFKDIKGYLEEVGDINKEINIINKKLHTANIRLKAKNRSLKNRVKTLENEISDCSECQYENDKKLIEKAEEAVRRKT